MCLQTLLCGTKLAYRAGDSLGATNLAYRAIQALLCGTDLAYRAMQALLCGTDLAYRATDPLGSRRHLLAHVRPLSSYVCTILCRTLR
eukprot:546517-Rhodomonas_salina.1